MDVWMEGEEEKLNFVLYIAFAYYVWYDTQTKTRV